MYRIWLIFIFTFCFGYNIPQDFSFSDRYEVLLDYGIGWDSNSFSFDTMSSASSIIPEQYKWINRYVHSNKELHSMEYGRLRYYWLKGAGAYYIANSSPVPSLSLFSYSNISYDNFYYQFYIRATTNPNHLEHFYGIERDISRFGFSAAEIDISKVGYKNDFLRVDYGRSREIWGINSRNNIILSGYMPSFERLSAEFSFKNFYYRYFYGYLETKSDLNNDNFNRYIAGRMIEYNTKNILLSFGEVSILSGENRSIDMAYLNPFGFHLEIEQNGRSNSAEGVNSDNAIWFLAIDMILDRIRFSSSVIMDEFQLDREDREMGRPDALGMNIHFAYSPKGMIPLTLLFDLKSIGTYVYQHQKWYTNFVNRSSMLGAVDGNDMYSIEGGIRYVNWMSIFEISLVSKVVGQNSILNSPYAGLDSFITQSFPSGSVASSKYLLFSFDSRLFNNLNLSGVNRFSIIDKNNEINVRLEYIF